MPVYIGIVLKILSDFDFILTEHCFPKIVYIHIGQMFLRKFRFTSQLIVRIIAQVCEDFYHSCALCRKTAWSSLHTSKTLTAEKQSGGTGFTVPPFRFARVCLIDKWEFNWLIQTGDFPVQSQFQRPQHSGYSQK